MTGQMQSHSHSHSHCVTMDAMHVLSAAEMKACDRATTERFQTPSIELMRNAAAAVAGFAREQFPRARRVTVLCGTGNNGGDGMMAARLLSEAGLEVTTLLLGETDQFKGDAAVAWSELNNPAHGKIRVVAHARELGRAGRCVHHRFSCGRAVWYGVQAAAATPGAGGARVAAAGRRAGSRRGFALRLARRRNRRITFRHGLFPPMPSSPLPRPSRRTSSGSSPAAGISLSSSRPSARRIQSIRSR